MTGNCSDYSEAAIAKIATLREKYSKVTNPVEAQAKDAGDWIGCEFFYGDEHLAYGGVREVGCAYGIITGFHRGYQGSYVLEYTQTDEDGEVDKRNFYINPTALIEVQVRD